MTTLGEMLGKPCVEVFTPKELAKRWKCSKGQVLGLIQSGSLKAFRLGHKLLRIPQEAVEEYEKCQSIGLSPIGEDMPSNGKKTASAVVNPSEPAIVLTLSKQSRELLESWKRKEGTIPDLS